METEKINYILFLVQDKKTQLLSIEKVQTVDFAISQGDCSWFNILDSFIEYVKKFEESLPDNMIMVAHSHLWPSYLLFEWNVYSILSFKIDTNFDKGTTPFCDYRRMLLEYTPFSEAHCTGHLYYQLQCLSRYFPLDLKALYKEISFAPMYSNWENLFAQAVSLNNTFVEIVASGNPLNRVDYSYLD